MKSLKLSFCAPLAPLASRCSCQRRMFGSTVSVTMSRMHVVVCFCPILQMRPAACRSMPGCSCGSSRMAVRASVSVRPAAPPPPAPEEPPKSGMRSTHAPPPAGPSLKRRNASCFAAPPPASEAVGTPCARNASSAMRSRRVQPEKMSSRSPWAHTRHASHSSAVTLVPNSRVASATSNGASPNAAAAASAEASGAGVPTQWRCIRVISLLQRGHLPRCSAQLSIQSQQPECMHAVMHQLSTSDRSS
mmetsp:Transcript_22890/g.52819  ORF Transcript_22890/g.52819 Transcript_22890/m.52819 type:complete len:247 (+) Transcript_22890:368-1108(+)